MPVMNFRKLVFVILNSLFFCSSVFISTDYALIADEVLVKKNQIFIMLAVLRQSVERVTTPSPRLSARQHSSHRSSDKLLATRVRFYRPVIELGTSRTDSGVVNY